MIEIEGANHPKILNYVDALYKKKIVGARFAIIGSGGIGFDMAEYLDMIWHMNPYVRIPKNT